MKAITIFFLLYLNHIYSQNKVFFIKTEEGEPIPYVNIGIQGTQKGLISNKDGSFSSEGILLIASIFLILAIKER